MMRRTLPAVSFHPTSVNLMLARTKPVLGNEMNSVDRMAACYNDLPLTFIDKPLYQRHQWDDRRLMELGLRRAPYGTTKFMWISMNITWFAALLLFFEINYILIWMPIFQAFPEHMQREHGVEYSKKTFGVDVYCADGKFIRPYFHMTAPMFTMTADEL